MRALDQFFSLRTVTFQKENILHRPSYTFPQAHYSLEISSWFFTDSRARAYDGEDPRPGMNERTLIPIKAMSQIVETNYGLGTLW